MTLQTLRYEANLTQKQLSLKLGCSTSMVCMIESGKRKPTKEQLVKLAKVFGEDCVMGILKGREG